MREDTTSIQEMRAFRQQDFIIPVKKTENSVSPQNDLGWKIP
jgi:hypothetical protein